METLSELCSILKLEMLDDHILSNQNELKARFMHFKVHTEKLKLKSGMGLPDSDEMTTENTHSTLLGAQDYP